MTILQSPLIELLLLVICASIAYFVYRRYGLRKSLPVSLILILSVSVYILLSAPPKSAPELTPEVKQQIRGEQVIVADWYTIYKQDLTQLDLYWQQYHKNLTTFINDEISIQVFVARLTELEEKYLLYKGKYSSPPLPDKLRPTTADILTKIIAKTQSFIGSEYQVIKSSITIANETSFSEKTHQEQVQALEKIMVINSPILLNIAPEVNNLRETLVVPGED